MAHMVHTQNFLLQICFCFDFLVYSLIHRTKNLLCSNNWLRCHYTQQCNIFLAKKNVCGLKISSPPFTSWLIAPLIFCVYKL